MIYAIKCCSLYLQLTKEKKILYFIVYLTTNINTQNKVTQNNKTKEKKIIKESSFFLDEKI